jgi:hypothetical protein
MFSGMVIRMGNVMWFGNLCFCQVPTVAVRFLLMKEISQAPNPKKSNRKKMVVNTLFKNVKVLVRRTKPGDTTGKELIIKMIPIFSR